MVTRISIKHHLQPKNSMPQQQHHTQHQTDNTHTTSNSNTFHGKRRVRKIGERYSVEEKIREQKSIASTSYEPRSSKRKSGYFFHSRINVIIFSFGSAWSLLAEKQVIFDLKMAFLMKIYFVAKPSRAKLCSVNSCLTLKKNWMHDKLLCLQRV